MIVSRTRLLYSGVTKKFRRGNKYLSGILRTNKWCKVRKIKLIIITQPMYD